MYTVRSKLADAREDKRGSTLPALMVMIIVLFALCADLANDVALGNRGG